MKTNQNTQGVKKKRFLISTRQNNLISTRQNNVHIFGIRCLWQSDKHDIKHEMGKENT